MSVKHNLRKLFWKIGYDITKFDPLVNSIARRKKLFESYKINIVLDVGANTGQFAKQIRNDIGYKGKILSFEPVSRAYKFLEIESKKDPKWEVFHYALGEIDTKRKINISKNLQSSSFLNMLPVHLQAAPMSVYTRNELIKIKTLDSIFENVCSNGSNVYLKIDTQGYEERVIKGAEKSLINIDTIQLEMSLIPLYEGESLFNKMYNILIKKGYSMVSIEPVFLDQNSGKLMQIDGIFHRFKL